jgi:hypothetical protein
MPASELGAPRHSQQLQLPPPRSTAQFQSLLHTGRKNCLNISSILNGPASTTPLAKKNTSCTAPIAEGCIKTFPQVARENLVSKFFVKPQLPPHTTQSHEEQQHKIPSPSWPEKLVEAAARTSAKIPLSQDESPSSSVSLLNPPSSQKWSAPNGNVKQLPHIDMIPFQESLEAALHPYNTVVVQSQQGLFNSSSACSLGQTSASEPVPVLTMTTSEDIHQVWQLAEKKRVLNAQASMRFRKRRKEEVNKAKHTINELLIQGEELQKKIKSLEQERDFYRGERDRYRDMAFKHHPGRRSPELQFMRPATPQGLKSQTANRQTPIQTESYAK